MNRTLLTLVFMTCAHLLTACSEAPVRASGGPVASVSSAHSVYIENGILKLLNANGKTILYVYVRPKNTGHWLATGGGGGLQDKPWLFRSASTWTLGDENHEYTGSSLKKSFSFIFDNRNMTLTTDSGSYAVTDGDFIVITLDSDWKTGSVQSGVGSLQGFDMPDVDRQQLVRKVQSYTGN